MKDFINQILHIKISTLMKNGIKSQICAILKLKINIRNQSNLFDNIRVVMRQYRCKKEIISKFRMINKNS